jgi:hypothetical protein
MGAGVPPLIDELAKAAWKPSREAVSSLPGFTNVYWRHVLGRCYNTIARWQGEGEVSQEAMAALTPADGMMMARLRGPCQMPYWSRIAILDYRKRGWSVAEIARAFQCSRRTTHYLMTRGTGWLTIDRQLTRYQKNPPARFKKQPENGNTATKQGGSSRHPTKNKRPQPAHQRVNLRIILSVWLVFAALILFLTALAPVCPFLSR